VYEADVHPFGSLHDRACELYQQLVGVACTQMAAERLKLRISDLVYGKEHMLKHHEDGYYKPKYLRTVEDKRHVMAYPNGIPGGWCKHRKIHFVGHSQGAQTIRYLQYLLSIDYFHYRNDFGCK